MGNGGEEEEGTSGTLFSCKLSLRPDRLTAPSMIPHKTEWPLSTFSSSLKRGPEERERGRRESEVPRRLFNRGQRLSKNSVAPGRVRAKDRTHRRWRSRDGKRSTKSAPASAPSSVRHSRKRERKEFGIAVQTMIVFVVAVVGVVVHCHSRPAFRQSSDAKQVHRLSTHGWIGG